MAAEISLPSFESNRKVRDCIISVLSEEYPLSVKQIHHFIERDHSVRVSYQAVHKVLLQLLNSKVLEKEGKNFKISSIWISTLKAFINNLEVRYGKEQNLLKKLLHSSDSASCVVVNRLSSIKEMDEFLLTFMEQESEFYSFVEHPWFPLIHTEGIAKYSSSPKAQKVVVCSDKQPLDKYCISYLKKLGEKVGVCKRFDSTHSFSIYGDYVVQAFFEKELMQELEKIYAKTKTMKSFNLMEFNSKFFERKTQIILITMYNPLLALMLKNKLKGYLKKQKTPN